MRGVLTFGNVRTMIFLPTTQCMVGIVELRICTDTNIRTHAYIHTHTPPSLRVLHAMGHRSQLSWYGRVRDARAMARAHLQEA